MKPRVQYIDLAGDVTVGCRARVFTYNHWRVRLRGWIVTSTVLKIFPSTCGPVFETNNTIYWPYETDESLPVATEKKSYDPAI